MFSWPPAIDDVGIAALNGLRGEHDRLQPRPADRVDGHRRDGIRDAGLDQRLARRILPAARGQHLTEDDFRYLFGLDAGLREQRADHGGAEFRRGHFGERSAKLADGGAQRTNDDDVGHGITPWCARGPRRAIAAAGWYETL